MKKFTSHLGTLFLALWATLFSLCSAQSNFRDQYLLRAGDKLSLELFEEPELKTTVTVSRTGHVALTYLDNVKVGGLSVSEAADLIKDEYGELIKNPIVTLRIEEYAAEMVTVIGQVVSPGDIPLPQSGEIEIASALATAGGLTEFADPENIRLTTSTGENIVLSLKKIQGEAGSLMMGAGDKLVALEAPNTHAKIWVSGQVRTPGPLPLPKIGRMDAATALASAGGLTDLADQAAIKIIPAKGSPYSLSYNAIQNGGNGHVLSDGDRILVAKSPFANTTVTVLGEVKSPGRIAFPVDGNFDLMEAISMAGGFSEEADLRKVTVTRNGNSFTRDVRDYGKDTSTKNLPTKLRPNDIITVGERWW